MHLRDLSSLLFLALLWGGSFLFMRTAVPEFGPVALITVRVGVAAVVLLGVIVWQQKLEVLLLAWKKLLLLGLINSCLPFLCFAWAALILPAGISSVLNATAPLWGALIGVVWLGERLTRYRVAGLFIAFIGVFILIWAQGRLGAGEVAASSQYWLAAAACLLATFLYGVSSAYTKKYLSGFNATVSAAGSQISSTLFLLPVVGFFLPSAMPSVSSWASALFLALFSTALAYLIFFRLITRIGPTRAITVTFLIPVFGCLLGVIFLKEQFTLPMLMGGVIVLLGTAMALGLRPKKTAQT